MSRGLAWGLAVAIIASVMAWQWPRLSPPPQPLPLLYTLGGDFELPSTRGTITSLADFRGDLVLLNFGYTSCPDVCPTALSRMRDAVSMLPQDEVQVHPVFITLDPDVDTIDRLQPYLQFFGNSFVGLTGTTQQISDAAAGYQVFYQRESTGSAMGYSISHSSHIYLLDTAGRVRATFGEGIPVDQIAQTIYQLSQEQEPPALAMRSESNGA